MKICMVNPLFLPYNGGTEKHVYEVSKRLAKKHEVSVLTARMKNTSRYEIIDGIKIYRTKALIINKAPHPLPPPFPVAPQMFWKIREHAKKNDVMHFHNRFTYNPFDFTLAKTGGTKLCMTLHNSRPEGIDPTTNFVGGFYDKLFGNVMMKQADRIAAVSKDTKERTVPPELWNKSSVIYNGVELDDYDPRISTEKVKKYGKYFLCVARLVEQKGLEYLIEAMKRVDARLVIKGSGPLEKKLKAQAGKNIDFITERISEEELAQLYKGCHAFVLPSLYEPFGMVLCEAMAMERPVIGTEIGGIPEIVTNGVGLLVKPKSSKELTDKMNYLLDNPQKADSMGKKGRKRVEENFTWDHSARAYEDFYKKLS